MSGNGENTAGRDNAPRRRPKGYAPWAPQAKARALLEAVDQVLAETCQLEALPPDLLAATVENAIRMHLRADLLDRELEAETADRIALTRALPA